MADYAIMVEFARDVVDDERHSELDMYLSASFVYQEH